ncbi:flippase-like domain-containing protein [Salinirubellus salinus]|uniref:Flippase-like domain-containing protein n=1 Tax=Salinirubellus salinus TaxID=1364945 RepID=A0A9E7R7Q5_9EURY|nr:lysylphosphatidylglycerol synthase transmembrane domain-containing protein [Salinirubellus salinus]UWM56773.1 flippase-like domain-containing protein [Salinirubellus salinus]
MDVDLRTTLVGFAGALLVLGGLVTVVGVGRVVDALQRADTTVLLGVLTVATVWLTSWGLSLRTVLGVLGSSVSARLAVLVFAAATFANNVTPFGQAGGEPVTALFISRTADTEYETGLAAIASVDSLNFVPSIVLALVGIGYFSVTVAFGRRLMLATVAVGALALVIPVAGYLVWRNRYAVERRVVSLLTPLIRGVGRLLPRRKPPDPAVIERRIEGFFHAIERVTGDRRGLALALGFSTLGWLSLATSLWLSLYALEYQVPFAAVLVVVPVAAIAGITPLPGGLGGVEAVLVALLVPTTGVSVAGATAAVVIHRTATYWLPTLVGGGAAAALGAGGVVQSLSGGPPERERGDD